MNRTPTTERAATGNSIVLRRARADDEAQVLSWRNDDFIVARSSSRRRVTEGEHHAWFAAALAAEDRRMEIVEIDGVAAGLVRFDRQAPDHAVISVYLLESFTGRGLGPRVISMATTAAIAAWGVDVHAHVRADNFAGRKAFERAGYGLTETGGAAPDHVVFVRRAGAGSEPDWRTDDEANRAYYDARVAEFGLDARAADWRGREGQYLRFEILAAVDALNGRRVLDVGCGTGEFLAWLRARNIAVAYSGVDVSPAMIEAARARFPEASFAVGSVLELPRLFADRFDHVFASGIFAHRRHDPAGFVAAAVAAMFAQCRRSTSFNSLSGWAPQREAGEYHLDPADALAIAHRLTARVALRHDYHRADFTMHMYREAQAS
ncbi:MAG: GNAT family N-acetyltransferase [Alphaproteobacteria bacterium]